MSFLRRSFSNPVVWLLLVALAMAAYGNVQKSRDLDRLCELSGPHEFVSLDPKSNREKLDNACRERQPD